MTKSGPRGAGVRKRRSALGPYRALDLSDEKGVLCGKILGDLGVDVIKIEPPGGDPCRRRGPFYRDIADPESSLFWFAYNTSKRGITLNIETPDGREIFRRLVATADFVKELDGLVEEWTTHYSPEEVMERMQTAGVPSGVVKNARDLLEDPQLKARGHFQIVNHPVVGPLPHPGWPAHLSKTVAEYGRAPLLGEHTEYVCSRILGVSDDELARLTNAGVLW
jgi:crotonobetainyl-CoA:carnitine CoA-transferase CaiB-like acyl-CoA transferase